MADTFKTKLGTTRAGERSRIWIEGARLVAAGFTCGARFRRTFQTLHAASLTLEIISEQQFETLPVSQRGTVSGKGAKPIIDITGTIVRDTFGKGTHVAVTYTRNTITITTAE